MHPIFEKEYLEKKYVSKLIQGPQLLKEVWKEYFISRPAWAFETWITFSGYKEVEDNLSYPDAIQPFNLVDVFILEYPEYEEFETEVRDYASDLFALSNVHYLFKEGYFEQLLDAFSDEFEDFFNFLSQFPHLGCQHDVGKKIYSVVRDRSELKNEIKNEYWWRGRKSKDFCEDIDIFPSEISDSEGRFNHYGLKNPLYLSDTRMGCVREAKINNELFFFLQQIEIKNVEILDLTIKHEVDFQEENDFLIFSALYDEVLKEQGRDQHSYVKNPGYLVSRFFADCVSSEGYSGIKYPNMRPGYGIYNNLVLFEFDKTPFGQKERYFIHELL